MHICSTRGRWVDKRDHWYMCFYVKKSLFEYVFVTKYLHLHGFWHVTALPAGKELFWKSLLTKTDFNMNFNFIDTSSQLHISCMRPTYYAIEVYVLSIDIVITLIMAYCSNQSINSKRYWSINWKANLHLNMTKSFYSTGSEWNWTYSKTFCTTRLPVWNLWTYFDTTYVKMCPKTLEFL